MHNVLKKPRIITTLVETVIFGDEKKRQEYGMVI